MPILFLAVCRQRREIPEADPEEGGTIRQEKPRANKSTEEREGS